nr:MAG TPA: hypothetical protein [Caudoviricetes sp.]
MTLRDLVLANEQWYLDTPLLVIDSDIKRAMTVEEILGNDEIGIRTVISFNRSKVYLTERVNK